MAAAPDWTSRIAAVILPAFLSTAICLIAFTRFAPSEGRSMAASADSLDCAAMAALAAPQGPSHHQSRFAFATAGAALTARAAVGFDASMLLYPIATFFDFAQSTADGVRRAPYGNT